LALPFNFKTNKTMAKKAMGPGPKKGMKVDSMLTGKTFGKVLKPGQKSDTYFYAEGVRGGGQGGIKMKAAAKGLSKSSAAPKLGSKKK
jgi:hypothetical protein